ncbi:MAG TPA: thioredoxin domain-containing protein [Rhizomicrobium sp.]|jgi:protein-disulfide isomerase|nr:thioredoxin domain-containing protein [Rhizomicrobium sp.]
MNQNWKLAVLGGLGGAALALVVVFAAAWAGALPTNERTIHDYMLAHPQILTDMMAKLQAGQADDDDRARQEAITKMGTTAFFDPKVAFIAGPANAKNTFVEFFDYNCPYCRASMPSVKRFYAAHKNDTRFAFIEFPIKGPESLVASRAAMAARRQPDKYLAFHFLLMNEQQLVDRAIVMADAKKAGLDMTKLEADMKTAEVENALIASHHLAVTARIDGTPAFIVNGHMREGGVDDSDIAALVKG